jgi:hypothetical protein
MATIVTQGLLTEAKARCDEAQRALVRLGAKPPTTNQKTKATRARRRAELLALITTASTEMNLFSGLLGTDLPPQRAPIGAPKFKVHTQHKLTEEQLQRSFNKVAHHYGASGAFDQSRGGRNQWTATLPIVIEDATQTDLTLISELISRQLDWPSAVALLIARFKRKRNVLVSEVLHNPAQGPRSVRVYTDEFRRHVQEQLQNGAATNDDWESDHPIYIAKWAEGLHAKVRRALSNSGLRTEAERSFTLISELAMQLEDDFPNQEHLQEAGDTSQDETSQPQVETSQPRKKQKRERGAEPEEKADTYAQESGAEPCQRCHRNYHTETQCKAWYTAAGLRLPGVPPAMPANTEDMLKRCGVCGSHNHNNQWCATHPTTPNESEASSEDEESGDWGDWDPVDNPATSHGFKTRAAYEAAYAEEDEH